MVKKILFLGLLMVSCVPTTMPTSQTVYFELIDAGCLAPGDSSLIGVELGVLSDAQPPWFSCLLDSGTIQGCSVPCGNKP
jgi:hypothetical protein